MNIQDRLKFLIKSVNMNVATFSKAIDIKQVNLHNVVSGRRNVPSLKIVIAIVEYIPNVNLYWLILGTGSMFLDQYQETENDIPLNEISEPDESYLYTALKGCQDQNKALLESLLEKEKIIQQLRKSIK